MKLSNLARTYQAVQAHFSKQFKNAEVCFAHDTIYLHLDKPRVFSDKELKFLKELGLHTDDTEGSDNPAVSFYMFI